MEVTTLEDLAGILLVAALASLVTMIFSTLALSFFVGLKQPPVKRALWTVAAAYVIAVLLWVIGGPTFPAWVWPVGAVPSALALYAYLCWYYGRTWFDEVSGLPDGVAPAETDWRNGLLRLAALIVVATVAASVRSFIKSI